MESRNVDQDHECMEEDNNRQKGQYQGQGQLYNYAFEVKYQQIKDELMSKVHQDQGGQDGVYSEDDIVDICQKLYVDEILSVFDAESMFDDKIDVGLATMTNTLMTHPEYQRMAKQELSLLATDDKMRTDYAYDFDSESESNQLHLLSCMLFSEGVFHVTHRVLQQLKQDQGQDVSLLTELQQALHKIILENQSIGAEVWQLYKNEAPISLAGNGLIGGYIPCTNLSTNSVDIESFLFGTGSTNLTKPMPPPVFTPHLTCLPTTNLFETRPVIMPIPQAISNTQRPFPV